MCHATSVPFDMLFASLSAAIVPFSQRGINSPSEKRACHRGAWRQSVRSGPEPFRERFNQTRVTAPMLVARSVPVHRHFRASAVLAFDRPKRFFLHGAAIRLSAHTAYGPCRPAREYIQRFRDESIHLSPPYQSRTRASRPAQRKAGVPPLAAMLRQKLGAGHS